jgi:protein-S-isoprenylcysteine O-methyltransferase Ste14
LGVAFVLIGQLIFLVAKTTNKFFSSVVRIQHDRGHTVCDTGIYTFVRHPGYLGMIISWVGFPILLASLWSIIPVAIAIVLLLVRTRLEDETLTRELAGYTDYTKRTHYKLIPGIW